MSAQSPSQPAVPAELSAGGVKQRLAARKIGAAQGSAPLLLLMIEMEGSPLMRDASGRVVGTCAIPPTWSELAIIPLSDLLPHQEQKQIAATLATEEGYKGISTEIKVALAGLAPKGALSVAPEVVWEEISESWMPKARVSIHGTFEPNETAQAARDIALSSLRQKNGKDHLWEPSTREGSEHQVAIEDLFTVKRGDPRSFAEILSQSPVLPAVSRTLEKALLDQALPGGISMPTRSL